MDGELGKLTDRVSARKNSGLQDEQAPENEIQPNMMRTRN